MSNKRGKSIGNRESLTLTAEINRLYKSSASAFLTKVIGAGSSLLLALLVARYLGAEQAGVYYTAITLGVFCSFLACMGLDQPLMREAAAFKEGCNNAFLQMVGRAVKMGLFGLAIVTCVFIFAADNIAAYFRQSQLENIIPLWTIVVVSTVIINLSGQILRGFNRILEASFIFFGSVNILTLILLIIAMMFDRKVLSWIPDIEILIDGISIRLSPLEGALTAYILASIATALLAFVKVRNVIKSLQANNDINEEKIHYRKVFASGFSFLIIGVSTRGLNWIAILILAKLQDSEQVAIFSSAQRIALSIGFVLDSVAMAVGPKFVELYRKNDLNTLQKLYLRSTMLTIVIILPIVIILWLYGPIFMSFFGPEFIVGSTALIFLCIAQFISAVAGPNGQVMIAAHKEKVLRNIAFISFPLVIAFHLLFVPSYGYTGTAAVTALTIILTNIVISIFVYKKILFRN